MKRTAALSFVVLVFIVASLMITGCGGGGSSETDSSIGTPTPSIAPGTYNENLLIELSTTTPGALIYYTTNGADPTIFSTLYTAPIPVTGNGTTKTIRAIAVRGGTYPISLVMSATYAIDYNNNATYIDPSAPVSGDGSYLSPFKTWAEVTFAQGQTYRQKCGTVAREQVTVTASGTLTNPIIIESYGTGNKPVIQGSEIQTTWTLESGSIYSKVISLGAGQGLGMLAEDGTVLNFISWDTDVATTFATASAGCFSFDAATDTIYVWCSDSADPDTHIVEVSTRLYGIRGLNKLFVFINGMHIRYASLHGISFENGRSISVSDCTVEKLGGAVIVPSPIVQAGNGIEFANTSSNCTVDNCTINDIFDSGVSPQTFADNKTASGFTFSNCAISRCGFAGIEVAVLSNGGTTGSSISDVTITGMTVTDCGTGWSGIRYGSEGRGIKVSADVGAGTMSGVNISQSTVTGSAGEGIYIGGDSGVVTVERTRVHTNELDGIAVVSAGTTAGLNLSSSLIYSNGSNGGTNDKLGVLYNVPSGAGYNLYHNTFYDNAFIGFGVWNQDGNARLTNNIFYGSVPTVHFVTLVALPFNAEVHNNCFMEFNPGDIIINYDNGSGLFETVSAFEGALSLAQNNIGDNPDLDVDFTLLSPSSPPFQAGKTATGVTLDYAGLPYLIPPTVGAYEY